MTLWHNPVLDLKVSRSNGLFGLPMSIQFFGTLQGNTKYKVENIWRINKLLMKNNYMIIC